MRVVSQDGQVDMPYDSIIINRDGGVVLANIVGEEEGAIVVAEYRDIGTHLLDQMTQVISE